MANELQLDYGITGKTLYALILNAGGQIYNGSTFETPLAAHWSTYAVTMTEQSTTGMYEATFPALAAGTYGISVRLQAGASPATTDLVVGVGTMYWNGVAFTPGSVGVPTNPTLCRVYGYEYLNAAPVAGREVTAKLAGLPQATSTVILEGDVVTTTTDATGYWYLDLVQGKHYQISIPEAGVKTNLVIPAQTTLDLRTVL